MRERRFADDLIAMELLVTASASTQVPNQTFDGVVTRRRPPGNFREIGLGDEDRTHVRAPSRVPGTHIQVRCNLPTA